MRNRGVGVSMKKAGEMLRPGMVQGKATKKQRGFFGLVRGGGRPTRLTAASRRRRVSNG